MIHGIKLAEEPITDVIMIDVETSTHKNYYVFVMILPNMSLVTLTHVLCFILLITHSRSCPAVCSCEYPRIVYCAGMQLREVPSDVPVNAHALILGSNFIHFVSLESFIEIPNLIELHLDRNLIGFIPSKAFFPLKRLKFLDLRYNRIKLLSRLSFSGLNELERLYLAGNMLSTLPVDSLTFVPKLNSLNLYDNPLKEIPDSFFSKSSELTSLNMGKCHIRSLTSSKLEGLNNLTSLILSENENLDALQDNVFVDLPNLEKLAVNHAGLKRVTSLAFAGLRSLTELLLDHNLFVHTLPLNVFHDIPQVETLRLDGNLLSSLHYSVISSMKNVAKLQLDDNRWRCDCGLLGVRAFWPTQKPRFLKSPGIRCSYPDKYRDMNLWNIPVPALVESCLRTIERTTKRQAVQLGSRVNLTCSLPQTNGSYLAWFSSNTVYIPASFNYVNDSRFQIQPNGDLSIDPILETDLGPFICSVTYPDGATALRAVVLYTNDRKDPNGNQDHSSILTYALIIASFSILTILIVMLLLVVIFQRKTETEESRRPTSYNPFTFLTLHTRRRIEEAYAYAYADVHQRQREPADIDAYAISGNITEEKFKEDLEGSKEFGPSPLYGTLTVDYPSPNTTQETNTEYQSRDSNTTDAYAYVSPNRIHQQKARKRDEKEETESQEKLITADDTDHTIDTNEAENRESNAYVEILD